MTRRDDSRGFTLVEVLLVILILGVLAGTVVFLVGHVGQRASESACKADAKTLSDAIAVHMGQPKYKDTSPMEQTLVDEGFLKEPSVYYTISDQGSGVPGLFSNDWILVGHQGCPDTTP